MEMTGLDPAVCVPVEIAAVVTSAQLEELGSMETVIYQPEEKLSGMAPVVVEMHTKSGLLDRIRSAQTSLAQADEMLAGLLAQHVEPGRGVLAGNSIHTDRAFIRAYFPKSEQYLHYRMIDVSSFKEVVRRWYGEEALYKKDNAHTAMADIRESIAELAHYRATVFTR